MTFTLVYLAYRKPGTTPAEFRTHYDEKHLPKIKEMTDQLFPLSHVRRYLHRTTRSPPGPVGVATSRNPHDPATLLSGAQSDFDYDAMVEMVFEDEAAFRAFHARLREPENAKWIADDEATFLDREKVPPIAVLGDITRIERGT